MDYFTSGYAMDLHERWSTRSSIRIALVVSRFLSNSFRSLRALCAGFSFLSSLAYSGSRNISSPRPLSCSASEQISRALLGRVSSGAGASRPQ
eukprot:scaffold3540_cov379-Prasinococcus_capsulatus_cf.AAC.6